MKRKLSCVILIVMVWSVSFSLAMNTSSPPTTQSQVMDLMMDPDGLPMTVLQAAKQQNTYAQNHPAGGQVRVTIDASAYDAANTKLSTLPATTLHAAVTDSTENMLKGSALDSAFGTLYTKISQHLMSNLNVAYYYIYVSVESAYVQQISDSKTIEFSGTDGYYIVIDENMAIVSVIASYADASNGQVYIGNYNASSNFKVGVTPASGAPSINSTPVSNNSVSAVQTFSNQRAVLTNWENFPIGNYHSQGNSSLGDVALIHDGVSANIGMEIPTTTTTTQATTTTEATTTTTTEATTTTASTQDTNQPGGVDSTTDSVTTAAPENSDDLLDQLSKYSDNTGTRQQEQEGLGAALLTTGENQDDDNPGSASGLQASNRKNTGFFDKAVGDSTFNVSNMLMFLIPLTLLLALAAFFVSSKLVNKGDREFIR